MAFTIIRAMPAKKKLTPDRIKFQKSAAAQGPVHSAAGAGGKTLKTLNR
jgi:hypothetical protein